MLYPNFQTRSALHLFGVCDGHGPNGQEASLFVKNTLRKELEQRIKKNEHSETIALSLRDSFTAINDAFQANVLNSDHSGTTCCAVMFVGHRLITANVGESRAIKIDIHSKAV